MLIIQIIPPEGGKNVESRDLPEDAEELLSLATRAAYLYSKSPDAREIEFELTVSDDELENDDSDDKSQKKPEIIRRRRAIHAANERRDIRKRRRRAAR